MMAVRAWEQVARLWRPPQAAPAAPLFTDELVTAQTERVRRMLDDLAAVRCAVTLQSDDGGAVGTGVLAHSCRGGIEISMESGRWPSARNMNVVASGPTGPLMFSLADCECPRDGVLRAPWPAQLVHVQSRRHFRLRLARSVTQPVRLVWHGAGLSVPVRDISEAGISLVEAAGDRPLRCLDGEAELQLGQIRLTIPALVPVYRRQTLAGQDGRLGARLGGMSPEHTRALRRWLAAQQADGRSVVGRAG